MFQFDIFSVRELRYCASSPFVGWWEVSHRRLGQTAAQIGFAGQPPLGGIGQIFCSCGQWVGQKESHVMGLPFKDPAIVVGSQVAGSWHPFFNTRPGHSILLGPQFFGQVAGHGTPSSPCTLATHVAAVGHAPGPGLTGAHVCCITGWQFGLSGGAQSRRTCGRPWETARNPVNKSVNIIVNPIMNVCILEVTEICVLL